LANVVYNCAFAARAWGARAALVAKQRLTD